MGSVLRALSIAALLICGLAACGGQEAGPTTEVPEPTPNVAEATPPAAAPADETAPPTEVEADVTPPIELGIEEFAAGFQQPLHVSHAGDGSGRIFVVEKAGRIHIVVDGERQSEPFLDISDVVGSRASEQGLFAVAFHPEYRTNDRFFVHYTDQAGDTVVARYLTSDDPNVADAQSAEIVLTQDQPFPNHNGGQIAFGPDGYLYIGLGDGGSGGDPQGHGQDRGTLLGAILRIDVDGDSPYAVPADNPFVDEQGARAEIWGYGLRNPWRFSFDRETGDIFIADVGQNQIEAIHWTSAGSGGGINYGWNVLEGSSCFSPSANCDRTDLDLPILEYEHNVGCSVTGGFRYRGTGQPAFGDAYIYGDYCSGRVWASAPGADGEWANVAELETGLSISSFGEDEAGELYLTDLRGGGVYRLVSR